MKPLFLISVGYIYIRLGFKILMLNHTMSKEDEKKAAKKGLSAFNILSFAVMFFMMALLRTAPGSLKEDGEKITYVDFYSYIALALILMVILDILYHIFVWFIRKE